MVTRLPSFQTLKRDFECVRALSVVNQPASLRLPLNSAYQLHTAAITESHRLSGIGNFLLTVLESGSQGQDDSQADEASLPALQAISHCISTWSLLAVNYLVSLPLRTITPIPLDYNTALTTPSFKSLSPNTVTLHSHISAISFQPTKFSNQYFWRLPFTMS